jgi:hypothetical protein
LYYTLGRSLLYGLAGWFIGYVTDTFSQWR